MSLAVVVRHARAAGNDVHRFIGQSDVPLAPEGREQSRLLAARLAAAGPDRIVSSDLGRCLDTIGPLAEATGLTVEPDPRLREVANGEWTGLLPEEIAERWPDLWHRYRTGEDVRRPGGEQWSGVRARVRDALEEIRAGGGELVVVVTHGGPAILAAEWALQMELTGNVFRGALGAVRNASITTIDLSGPRLLGFNDTGHLGPALVDAEVPYAAVTEPDRP